MKRNLQVFFVFLIVLISFRFFDARFLNKSLVNIVVFSFLSTAILISIPYTFRKSEGFVFPIQLIVISMGLSIFMAKLGWNQSYTDTIIATVPFIIWIFFFYLLHIDIPVKTIERIILFYGCLYLILFFFQFKHSSTILFGKSIGGWDEAHFSNNRGTTRIVFPGGGAFFLVTFIAINKLTIKAKKRWLWITLTALGLIVPILQVTRQFIFSVCVIYLFHFTKRLPNYKKVLYLGLSIGLFFYLININNSMVKGIAKASKTDLAAGDDYIRVLAADYFINDFSPSTMNELFGNGASYGISNYGIFVAGLEEKYGFFKSDVGIIGMYTMFGILTTIAYIIIWIKSFTIALPEEYQYLKYYLWFLLLTSLTWYSVYHYHYLITTVFVLYLYQVISKKITEEHYTKTINLK